MLPVATLISCPAEIFLIFVVTRVTAEFSAIESHNSHSTNFNNNDSQAMHIELLIMYQWGHISE